VILARIAARKFPKPRNFIVRGGGGGGGTEHDEWHKFS